MIFSIIILLGASSACSANTHTTNLRKSDPDHEIRNILESSTERALDKGRKLDGSVDTDSKFLGCYADAADRSLPILKGSSKSVDQCSDLCDGYKYFARQWKGECWCGNDSYSKHGSSTGCDCMGPNVGAWKQCVYEKKPSNFLGCYADAADRALPVLKGSSKSVDQCSDLCDGYKYFARQWKGECWCGNDSYSKHGSSTGCDCMGPNVGAWKQCVYEKKSTGSCKSVSRVNTAEPNRGRTGPGFKILNDTPFPIEVSIGQTGPLYWELIQPGKWMYRETGAVWFTLKAYTRFDGKAQIDHWAAVVPVLVIVGSVAAAIATAGSSTAISASVAAGGAAGSVSGAAVVAVAQVLVAAGLKAGTALYVTTSAAAATGAVITSTGVTMAVKEAVMEDINGLKEDHVYASDAGVYAGYPWPFEQKTQAIRVTGGHPGFEAGTTEKGECVTVFDKSKLTNLKFECISGSCFVG